MTLYTQDQRLLVAATLLRLGTPKVLRTKKEGNELLKTDNVVFSLLKRPFKKAIYMEVHRLQSNNLNLINKIDSCGKNPLFKISVGGSNLNFLLGTGFLLSGICTITTGVLPFAVSLCLIGIGSIAVAETVFNKIINNRFDAIVGSGVRAQKTLDLHSHFLRKLCLKTPGNLVITQGNGNFLRLSGDDNILNFLTQDINGKELTLGMKSGITIQPKLPVSYHLTMTNPEQIEILGSGKVYVDDLNLPTFSCTLTGNGSFKVTGKTIRQNVNLLGSGSYQAEGLRSDHVKVVLNGSGKIDLQATKTLNVLINGSGLCSYSGTPKKIQSSVNGSGKLHRV